MDANIKNLLKKPASGGIPAIDNKIMVKVIEKTRLLTPIATQLARYFG